MVHLPNFVIQWQGCQTYGLPEPARQNRPAKGSNPAHWMTLQSVKIAKKNINFENGLYGRVCVLTSASLSMASALVGVLVLVLRVLHCDQSMYNGTCKMTFLDLDRSCSNHN